MRYCLPLLILFICSSPPLLLAQFDSLEIEYIHVEKPRPVINHAKRIIPQKDFYRNKSLLRVPFLTPHFDHLLYAKPIPGSFEGQSGTTQQVGIINLLMEALRLNDINGYYPDSLRGGYDYAQLKRDLMTLSGMDPNQGRFMDLNEMGGEWMSEYLDLIVDEGFSAKDSKYFVRIRFLRLIWFDPNNIKGPKAMVIFPYEEVSYFLDQMTIQLPNHGSDTLTAKEFLERRLNLTLRVKVNNRMQKLLDTPPQDKRVQEAELWEY